MFYTHMLVLAVDVSHSPANPMMSNPVDSWLKNLGWPAIDKETIKLQAPQKTINHVRVCERKWFICNLYTGM